MVQTDASRCGRLLAGRQTRHAGHRDDVLGWVALRPRPEVRAWHRFLTRSHGSRNAFRGKFQGSRLLQSHPLPTPQEPGAPLRTSAAVVGHDGAPWRAVWWFQRAEQPREARYRHAGGDRPPPHPTVRL